MFHFHSSRSIRPTRLAGISMNFKCFPCSDYVSRVLQLNIDMLMTSCAMLMLWASTKPQRTANITALLIWNRYFCVITEVFLFETCWKEVPQGHLLAMSLPRNSNLLNAVAEDFETRVQIFSYVVYQSWSYCQMLVETTTQIASSHDYI